MFSPMVVAAYDDQHFGGFWSKVKKVGKAAVKTVTTPVMMPVTIAKDIKSKGWKKGLKAIPSRAFVDPVTSGNRLAGETVGAVGGKKAEAMAGAWDTAQGKFEKWTQKRPIQTMAMAAAAAAAGYYAIPAAVAAAPGFIAANAGTIAEVGGAVVAAGGAAAKKAAGGDTPTGTDASGTPVTPDEIAAAQAMSQGAGGGSAAVPLAGAGVGFLVAGPIGAVVGLIAGSIAGRKA